MVDSSCFVIRQLKVNQAQTPGAHRTTILLNLPSATTPCQSMVPLIFAAWDSNFRAGSEFFMQAAKIRPAWILANSARATPIGSGIRRASEEVRKASQNSPNKERAFPGAHPER
jgi:hypothetical protein